MLILFSPSCPTSHQEPISFIPKDTANQEVEEVEENIALNTLGTIIHETLKSLMTHL
jgi:hypothetical protein